MRQLRNRSFATMTLAATLIGPVGAGTLPTYAAAAPNGDGQDGSQPAESIETASPIKHVIVLIGENRTFDNIFATYVPQEGQQVSNLLSKGIIDASGFPGSNHALAEQFKIGTINPVSYFIDTDTLTNPNKTAYAPFLPTPEVGSAPPRPVTLAQFLKDPADTVAPFDARTFSQTELHTISPVIEHEDLKLLTTGATGLHNCTADPTLPPSPCAEPDTRISNFNPTATSHMRHRPIQLAAATTCIHSSAFHAATTPERTRWASLMSSSAMLPYSSGWLMSSR